MQISACYLKTLMTICQFLLYAFSMANKVRVGETDVYGVNCPHEPNTAEARAISFCMALNSNKTFPGSPAVIPVLQAHKFQMEPHSGVAVMATNQTFHWVLSYNCLYQPDLLQTHERPHELENMSIFSQKLFLKVIRCFCM